MKDNWLEGGLKDKLDGYGSSMDFEAAWSALDEQRSSKKRGLYGLWLSSVLVVFALGVFGYWYSGTSEPQTEISELPQVLKNTETERVENQSTLTTLSRSSQEEYQQFGEQKAIEDQQTTQSLVKPEPSMTKQEGALICARGLSTQSKDNAVVMASTQQVVDSSKAGQITKTRSTQSITPIFKDKESKYNLLSPMTSLSKYSNKLDDIEPKVSFGDLAVVKSKVDCPKVQKSTNSYIGVGVGYGPRASGALFAEETPLDVASAQLYYQQYLSKTLYLKTGVSISQYTNSVEDSRTNMTTITATDQVVAIYHYQDGSTTDILGTANVDRTETYTYQLYNKYTLVSIPVMLGLKVMPRKQSYVQVEAGVSTTVGSKYDIKYFDVATDNKFMPVQDLGLRQYGLFHGVYGLQWNYTPTFLGGLELFAKYQGALQFNDIGNTSSTKSTKLNAQQVFLGMQMRL